MSTKQVATELLNQFLLSDESDAITKLETIKTYCTSVIEGGDISSKHFAESILEYLKDD